MAMFKVGNVVSRYAPFASYLIDDVAALFDSVRVVKHCTEQPDGLSPELTLSVKGRFNGQSVYVVPSWPLAELIGKVNIYGDPVFKDIYLTVELINGEYFVGVQYQQIIGSYKLFTLTEQQYRDLCRIAGLPVDIKRNPKVPAGAFNGSYFVVNDVTKYAIESCPSQPEAEAAAATLNAHELRCQQALESGEVGAKARQFYTYSVIEGDF